MAKVKHDFRAMLQVAADLAEEQGASEDFIELLRWVTARARYAKEFEADDIVKHAMGIKEREYHKSVQASAEDIVDGADGDREAMDARVAEYADDSYHVIYTHEAIWTLLSSQGELGNSFGEAMTRMAFGAFEQDLQEAVMAEAERRAENEDEDEDEDEDDVEEIDEEDDE